MPAQKDYSQRGFAPIIIIIIVCLGLVGFFLFQNFPKPTPTAPPKTVPTVPIKGRPTAEPQPLSLKEQCLAEMKNLPKPPFRYQSQSEPVGTLQPIYRKERFQSVKNISSCYTSFMFNRVIEQAYADMGVQYYERDRYGNRFIKTGAIAAFEKAVDSSLSQSFQKEGWKRTTQIGETKGGVPVMILTKNKGGREFFLDITYPGASGVAFSYVLTVMER